MLKALSRAAGFALIGAFAFVSTHTVEAAPQDADSDRCYGCYGGLGALFLEFPLIVFPDGTWCMVRHNFFINNGSCKEVPPSDVSEPGTLFDCVEKTPCDWGYDVICTGNGCIDPVTGAPRIATGTISFNGINVAMAVPCGLRLSLGQIPCGFNATVTNIVYAPGAAGGPYLVALTNSAWCTPCNEC